MTMHTDLLVFQLSQKPSLYYEDFQLQRVMNKAIKKLTCKIITKKREKSLRKFE